MRCLMPIFYAVKHVFRSWKLFLARVVDYLVKVNMELGKIIIMVTHDPSVARAADRILRIEDVIITAQL